MLFQPFPVSEYTRLHHLDWRSVAYFEDLVVAAFKSQIGENTRYLEKGARSEMRR